MLIARLHSIGVSLLLHAGLLGLAARGSSQPSPQASVARRAALETIAIEAADALGHPGAAAPAPPNEPAVAGAAIPASALAVPDVLRARERRLRPRRAAEPAVPRQVVPLMAASSRAIDPVPPEELPAGNSVPSSIARTGGSEPSSMEAAAGASAPVSSGAAASGMSGNRAGGGSATSSASADARAELLARYAARVRARVEQYREYPYLARRANLEGTICLRISIGASGGVLGVTPTCGASHEPLLAAALKSVSSAAPFPPLPAALGGRLTLDVPVVFQLDAL
jgi:periplasmic protein TonB